MYNNNNDKFCIVALLCIVVVFTQTMVVLGKGHPGSGRHVYCNTCNTTETCATATDRHYCSYGYCVMVSRYISQEISGNYVTTYFSFQYYNEINGIMNSTRCGYRDENCHDKLCVATAPYATVNVREGTERYEMCCCSKNDCDKDQFTNNEEIDCYECHTAGTCATLNPSKTVSCPQSGHCKTVCVVCIN